MIFAKVLTGIPVPDSGGDGPTIPLDPSMPGRTGGLPPSMQNDSIDSILEHHAGVAGNVPMPAPNCVLAPPPGGAPIVGPIIVGSCVYDPSDNFCTAGLNPIGPERYSARSELLNALAGSNFPRGVYAPDFIIGRMRQLVPEINWTSTQAPYQISVYTRVMAPPNQTTSTGWAAPHPASHVGVWLIFPNSTPPADFFDPAHPPIDASDRPYRAPQPGQVNKGPIARHLEAAMYTFFPATKFDWGGDTPGRLHPGMMVGSYFGGRLPFAYWLRTVSQEMIDFMVRFLTEPNPYDGKIGFGPEVDKHFSVGGAILNGIKDVQLGMQVGGAAQKLFSDASKSQQAANQVAAVQNQQQKNAQQQSQAQAIAAAQQIQLGVVPGVAGAASVGAASGAEAGAAAGVGEIGALAAVGSTAGPWGAAVGAGIGAAIALFQGIDGWLSKPDPPGWLQQLSKLDGIWKTTGAWYMVGESPTGYGGLATQVRVRCSRLWPLRWRGMNGGLDPRLDFTWRPSDDPSNPDNWNVSAQIPLPNAGMSNVDFSLAGPRSGPDDPLWTPLEAYAEVMRRVAGISPPTDIPSPFPWKWVVVGILGAGALVGGSILISRRKNAAPAAPATKGLAGRRRRAR